MYVIKFDDSGDRSALCIIYEKVAQIFVNAVRL